MNTQSFLEAMKAKAEATAKKMAAIELTVIDNKAHQKELKQYFGFTEKKIAARKKELQKVAHD